MASGRRIGAGNALWLYTAINYPTTPTFGVTPLTGTPFVLTRKSTLTRDGVGRYTLDLDSVKADSDLEAMLDAYTSPVAPPVEDLKFEDGGSEPGYPANTLLLAVYAGAIDTWAGSPSYGKRMAWAGICVIKNDSGSESGEYGKFVAPKFGIQSVAAYGTIQIGTAGYFPAAYWTTPATITINPSTNRFGRKFYI